MSYLIRESSNSPLVKDSKHSNILEGVFTVFNVQNRNGRIYTFEEFEPHYNEILEKVKQGCCLGTLDHPEDMEVKLSTASHVIEKLEYDSKKQQINGRIRLLTTEMGKTAQALVNDGINLSISSRAIGDVDMNNVVHIERLICWDIVSDPGFAQAKLNVVNESFGGGKSNAIFIPINTGIMTFDEYCKNKKRRRF